VEKTKEAYVLPFLNECYCVTTSFDLWMFKGAHDVFAMVIFFEGFNWKQKQVILDLFKVF
jgi:hypothetical protein